MNEELTKKQKYEDRRGLRMRYLIGNMVVTPYLEHHGIIGQKWGVRRYQNPDGSLTEAGKARYGYGSESKNSNYKDPKQLKRAQEGWSKAYQDNYVDIHNSVADKMNNGIIDQYNKQWSDDDYDTKQYEDDFWKISDYLFATEAKRILGDIPGVDDSKAMEEGRKLLKKYGIK